MYTTRFPQQFAKAGEELQMTFNITDDSGTPLNVDGATATLKLARLAGDPAIVTYTDTDGVTLSGSTAVGLIKTADLLDDDSPQNQLFGDFSAQLKIVKASQPLYVAEGLICVDAVIL